MVFCHSLNIFCIADMTKTAAQRQREYRERKKLKDPDFMLKETERVKRYYVPAAEMNSRQLDKKNKKARIANRVCRLKKKISMTNAELEEPSTSEPLIVRLPALTRSKKSPMAEKRSISKKAQGLTKSRKRALARAHQKIRTLKDHIANLSKTVNRKNKQMERLRKRSSTPAAAENNTPRKEVTAEIESMRGLSTTQRTSLKKRLLLGSALCQEIKATKDTTTLKSRRPLHNIIAGRITKKYRLIHALSEGTGLSRNSLGHARSKAAGNRKESRKSLTKDLKDSVTQFLKREDNCRVQPGKADMKRTEDGEKEQTVVLTDYMANLHLKYLAENADKKISLASFCRLRPRNVLLASFINRNSCQCMRHQNMALKVSALRKLGAPLSQNPDHLLDNENIDEVLNNLPASVPYKVWRRVTVVDNGKEFNKMKIIEESHDKDKFVEDFKKEVNEFKDHVQRVKRQYKELRNLKQNLPQSEVIVQMDFAENFACRSLEEIQSAYWNQTSVTLHPVVIYYKENEELKHKSIVVISDEMSHSASTVCTILDDLLPQIKAIVPNCSKVHYWTDSPTSQYRNKFIFMTIASHKDIYGVMATWNYFEAGHGKGPCDGLGGTTKRMADEAVRQGKAIIQNAADFYRWSLTSTMKEVIFRFIEKEDCEEKKKKFKEAQIKPVKNSLKLHSVVGLSQSSILTNINSCYCDHCLQGNHCDQWQHVGLEFRQEKKKTRDMQETETSADVPPEEQQDQEEEQRQPEQDKTSDVNNENSNANVRFEDLTQGKFVACVYCNDWYVGQIEDSDEGEREIQVNFMERTKTLYRWPSRRDMIWVLYKDVLCEISEPQPTAKSKRNFSVKENDVQLIKDLFEMHL